MNRLVVALALLVSACGGSAPIRYQYLLRPEAPAGGTQALGKARVGLDRVVIASYLDQSGIVVENADHEIRPASNHHWAEPLDEALRVYLRAELVRTLGEDVGLSRAGGDGWQYVVDVFVERFHGTMTGEAILVADFRIERVASGEATFYRFTRSRPLAQPGYAALVDAEAELTHELAGAIADALREMPRGRRGS